MSATNEAILVKETRRTLSKMPEYTSIETADQLQEVKSFMDVVKDVRKKIVEYFNPDIEKANQIHKSLIAKRNDIDAEPARIYEQLRLMVSDFAVREKRRREEEQRKLDEAAIAKAIKEAEKSGDQKTAKAIETGKIAVISEKVAEPEAKAEGISTRTMYFAEIVDIKELAKAVIKGTVPANYIEANTSVINAVVRNTKGQINIPGVAIRSAEIPIHR